MAFYALLGHEMPVPFGTKTAIFDVWASSGYTTVHGLPPKPEFLPRSWETRPIPVWGYDGSGGIKIPVNGVLSGTVTETGTPVPNCLVACYFRRNGFLIASTRSDVNGDFSFANLDPTDPSAYYVVALDPDGGVLYNALIFDRLTAV